MNMTIKVFIVLLVFAIAVIGAGVYFFHGYLFARVITPSTKNITIHAGEALSVVTGPIKPNTTLRVDLCSEGNCLPLAVDVTEDPIKVRIPIGHKTGPATLQIQEVTLPQKTTQLRLKIPLTIN